jgi:hypothetical protein
MKFTLIRSVVGLRGALTVVSADRSSLASKVTEHFVLTTTSMSSLSDDSDWTLRPLNSSYVFSTELVSTWCNVLVSCEVRDVTVASWLSTCSTDVSFVDFCCVVFVTDSMALINALTTSVTCSDSSPWRMEAPSSINLSKKATRRSACSGGIGCCSMAG